MLRTRLSKEGFDDAGTGECGILLLSFGFLFAFGNSKALHNGRGTVLQLRLRR